MATIKIHVLHCGQVVVDSMLPFSEKSWNPLAFAGFLRSKKHRLTLPVSTYLIEHPKGLVLIDSGWHTDVRINQFKYLGALLYFVNKAYLPSGQAIHEQLAQMGYSPLDIDYLLLSHLDCDHVSGLKLVKDAKRILVSKMDYEGALADPIRYTRSMWEGVKMEFFNFLQSEYGPYKQAYDLFGDGSLLQIYAPGHSKGMAVTLIRNNDKYVLLTSDCGYASKSWEQMILPGVVQNKEQLTTSLQWVREMAASPNCVEALANHDASIQPHTIEL